MSSTMTFQPSLDSLNKSRGCVPSSSSVESFAHERVVQRVVSEDREKVEFTGRRSNWEQNLFFEVYNALDKMSQLPAGHYMHLPDTIRERALSVLNVIQNNTPANSPRIINESGEALLLTWPTMNGKSYISVDEEDVDLLRVLKGTVDYSAELGEGGELNIETLLSEIKNIISSRV